MPVVLLTFLLIFSATTVHAAAAVTVWPKVTVLPWEHPGIDLDHTALARKALEQARRAVADEMVGTSATLSQWAERNAHPLTSNARAFASKILVGPPAGDTPPLVLQPIWCNVGDHDIIMIEALDPKRNVLLGSAHRALPRARLRDAESPSFSGPLLSAARDAIQAARTHQSPADALHIGIAASRANTSADEGSAHCLNALVAAALAPDHTVTRAIGNASLIFVRNVLGETTPLRRATRELVLRWDLAGTTLPLQLLLHVRADEAVRGGRILPDTTEAVVATLANDHIAPFPLPLVRGVLATEQKALQLADRPVVVKVDRGWVYLDRGRAWGIDLNDRLVYQNNGTVIKGHVVAFYGPGLALQSPRGFKVAEGAILFVRTGQAKAAIGQEFTLDPTAFPAAWPPKKTP